MAEQRMTHTAHISASNQNAPILLLPQELLGHVVSYVSSSRPAGLLRLRATCREIHTRTEQRVAKLFLVTRTFLLHDEWSLQALLGISKHPTFSKTMKHIGLSVVKVIDEAPAVCREQRIERFTQENRQRPFKKEDGHAFQERFDACNQLMATQRTFLGAKGHIRYLRSILTSFKAADNHPSLITTWVEIHWDHPKDGVGFPRIRGIIGKSRRVAWAHGYRLTSDVDDHRPLRVVYDVIREARYPITRFTLGCEELGLSLLHDRFPRAGLEFADLRVLELVFEPKEVTTEIQSTFEWHRRDLTRRLTQLRVFLRAAGNLETLTLAVADSIVYEEYDFDDSSFPIFGAITKEVTCTKSDRALRKLRKLHLSNFCYYASNMLAFVSATRSTLKSLKITHDPGDGLGGTKCMFLGDPEWNAQVLEAFGSDELELIGSIWRMSIAPANDSSVHTFRDDSEDSDND